MMAKMAYNKPVLSTQTVTEEQNPVCCYRLPPMAAAVIAQRRSLSSVPLPEPPQTEICLSPLLWSESFGLMVDG